MRADMPRPPDTALIVGDGASPGRQRLLQIAERYHTLIAADGGLAILRELELQPTLVVGDFDSVTPETLDWVPVERRRQVDDQDSTDLEKAIRAALESGHRLLGLACVTGGRLDHSQNAVSLMIRYRAEAELVLYDACGEARLAGPPTARIRGRTGDRISLIPAPAAMSITSRGLRYPLDGLDLVPGGRDGISNELSAEEAELTFASGGLLVYRQGVF